MRNLLVLFGLMLAPALLARDLGSRPIVLVHGYGPEFLIKLSTFRNHLTQDGIDPNKILLVSFDADAAIDDLTAKFNSQLQPFIAGFPAGTRFDVVGHSMGGFLGLYVPLQSVLGNQVAHYTALAGWTHGQDHLPDACRFSNGCGQTLPLLIPTDGPFLLSFFWENHDAIQRMQKCSLYSPDDTLTQDPINSGGFPDGVNVRVEGVKHLEFKDDLDVYHIFRTACYGEPAPAQGFKHQWKIQGATLK